MIIPMVKKKSKLKNENSLFPKHITKGYKSLSNAKKIESLTEILSFITSRFYARI